MKRIQQYESILKEIIKEDLTQCSNEDACFPLLAALFQEDLIAWTEKASQYLGVNPDVKLLTRREYHQIVPTVKGILLYETLRKANFFGKIENWFYGFLTVLISTIISRGIYDHLINPWIP